MRALGAVVNGPDGVSARLSGVVIDIDHEKRLEDAVKIRENIFARSWIRSRMR